MKRHHSRIALIVAGVLLFSVVAACLITFQHENITINDDEGMLTFDIQRVLGGAVLYRDMATIYGPLYFFYEWCAHAFGRVPVTLDSVRFVSAFFWAIASLLVFWLVYRTTRSLLLAFAAHFVALRTLAFVGTEPAHPQELCILLVLCLGLAACTISNRRTLSLVLGAIAGALAVTKINIGVFAVIALTLAFLLALKPGRWRAALLWPATAGAVVFPLLLMRAHLDLWWVQRFSIVAMISIAAAIVAIWPREIIERLEPQHFFFGALGFSLAAAAGCAFPIVRGSSLAEIINMLIVVPRASFGVSWFDPAIIPDVTLVFAAAGLACAIRNRFQPLSEHTVSFMKMALAGLVCVFSLLGAFASVFALVLPFLWIATLRPASPAPDSPGAFARTVMILMAVVELLYAYPAAGGQVPFVAVPIIVIAALGVSDALPSLASPASRRPVRLAAVVLSAAYVVSMTAAARGYFDGESIGLAGASLIRVPQEQARTIRTMADRIGSSPCTMLASAPGLLSFNLLTGKPAPALLNYGSWMLMMADADQRQISAELARAPYPCVVYYQPALDYWTMKTDASTRPLMKYIDDNFVPVFDISGYKLMEPRDKISR